MTHPNSLDLEAFACGEPSATVAAHVEECGACAAFVARLRGMVAAGPSAVEAEAAVARAMAGMSRDADGAEGGAESGRAARAPVRAPGAARRRAWMMATSVVMPLAAAAAILILARTPTSTGTSTNSSAGASPSGAHAVQIAAMPPREPETQFKGGAQIAVIRERGKEQARFSSTVRVRPGDRLRVEVALDREQAILGGVLAEDGSYLELMSQGVRGPGTHFSERSAKIDALPTRGTIVIGSPEAVARARETRLTGLPEAGPGLTTLRVEWEDGTP